MTAHVTSYILSKEISIISKRIDRLNYHLPRCTKEDDYIKLSALIILNTAHMWVLIIKLNQDLEEMANDLIR